MRTIRHAGPAVLRAAMVALLTASAPIGACSSSNLMQEGGGAGGGSGAGAAGLAQDMPLAGGAGRGQNSAAGEAGDTAQAGAEQSGGGAGAPTSGGGQGGTMSAGTSGVMISAGTSGMSAGGVAGRGGSGGSGVSGSSGTSGGSGASGSSGAAHGGGGASGSSGAAHGGGGASGSGGSSAGQSNGGNGGGAASCGNQVLDSGELCDPRFSVNGCGSDCKAITSSACTACEQLPTSLCGDYLNCDLATGTAAVGSPAAGIKRANLCNEVLDCVRDSGCANDGNAPIKCYCGTAVAAECQAGLGNGKCKAVLERGLETTTFSTITQRIGNVTFGGGLAMARIDCDQTFCSVECF